jgi:hypothetical protein
MGSIGKNKMLANLRKSINNQMDENQNWYDRRYNEDATQRADAQRILAMTEDRIRNRNKQSAGTAAVMGGTNESVAADKAANAQAMSDAASQIAVAGQARKDQVENQFQQRKNSLQSQLDNLTAQQQSAWDIAGNALGAAGQGFAGGNEAEDAFRKMKG